VISLAKASACFCRLLAGIFGGAWRQGKPGQREFHQEKLPRATWQGCRVHFARNALAHAGKAQRHIVSAVGRPRPTGAAYAQEVAAAAHAQWRRVADHLRPELPKLTALMDFAEAAALIGRSASDRRRHSPRTVRRTGHPALALQDPGSHQHRQR